MYQKSQQQQLQSLKLTVAITALGLITLLFAIHTVSAAPFVSTPTHLYQMNNCSVQFIDFDNALSVGQLGALNNGNSVSGVDTGLDHLGADVTMDITAGPPSSAASPNQNAVLRKAGLTIAARRPGNQIGGVQLDFTFSVARPLSFNNTSPSAPALGGGGTNTPEIVNLTAAAPINVTMTVGSATVTGNGTTNVNLEGDQPGDEFEGSTDGDSATFSWEYFIEQTRADDFEEDIRIGLNVCDAPAASAELAKSVNPTTVTAGDIVNYTYVITNSAVAADIDFLDDLPDDGRTYLADSFAISSSTGVTPTGYTINSYEGTDLLDVDGISMGASEIVTLTAIVNIPADLSGTVDNTANIASGGTQLDTASATLTVEPPQFPPIINPEEASTHRGVAITIPVLANDSDPDYTYYRVRQNATGSRGVRINTFDATSANGGTITQTDNDDVGSERLIYTPASTFTGVDTFTYNIIDTSGNVSASETVTVTVTDPPIATDDPASVNQGDAIIIDVLDNDSDPDGGVVGLTSFTQPANGTVTLFDNGTPDDTTDDRLIFTPDPGFKGNTSFTYTIMDDDIVCGVENIYTNHNQRVSFATYDLGTNSGQIIHREHPFQPAITTDMSVVPSPNFTGGVSNALFRFSPPGAENGPRINWSETPNGASVVFTFDPPLEAGDFFAPTDVDAAMRPSTGERMRLTFFDPSGNPVNTNGFGVEYRGPIADRNAGDVTRGGATGSMTVGWRRLRNADIPQFGITLDQDVSTVIVNTETSANTWLFMGRVGCQGCTATATVNVTVNGPNSVDLKTVEQGGSADYRTPIVTVLLLGMLTTMVLMHRRKES